MLRSTSLYFDYKIMNHNVFLITCQSISQDNPVGKHPADFVLSGCRAADNHQRSMFSSRVKTYIQIQNSETHKYQLCTLLKYKTKFCVSRQQASKHNSATNYYSPFLFTFPLEISMPSDMTKTSNSQLILSKKISWDIFGQS